VIVTENPGIDHRGYMMILLLLKFADARWQISKGSRLRTDKCLPYAIMC